MEKDAVKSKAAVKKERNHDHNVKSLKQKKVDGKHPRKSPFVDVDDSELGKDDMLHEHKENILSTSLQAEEQLHNLKSLPLDPDAESNAAEAAQEFLDEAWDICSKRFYHENVSTFYCLDLRDSWLRMIEMEWMDVDMVKRQHDDFIPKAMFMPDLPPRPLEHDGWTRGGLEEYPEEKRESILDPFLRDYTKLRLKNNDSKTWINGYELLGLKGTSTEEIRKSHNVDSSNKAEHLIKSKKKLKRKEKKSKESGKLKMVKSKSNAKPAKAKNDSLGKITSKNAKSKLRKSKIIGEKEKSTGNIALRKSTTDSKSKRKSKDKSSRKSKIPILSPATSQNVASTEVKLLTEADPALVIENFEEELLVPANTASSSLYAMYYEEDEGESSQMQNYFHSPVFIREESPSSDLSLFKQSPTRVQNELKNIMEPRKLEVKSSTDIAETYWKWGIKPWVPEDCGVWTGKGVFRLPRQTTEEAITALADKTSTGSVRSHAVSREKFKNLDLRNLSEITVKGDARQTQRKINISRTPNKVHSESRAEFLRKTLTSTSPSLDNKQNPVVINPHKLAPSERDFYDHKMHIYRIKLLRQHQLQEKKYALGEIESGTNAIVDEMDYAALVGRLSPNHFTGNDRSNSVQHLRAIISEKKVERKFSTNLIAPKRKSRKQSQNSSNNERKSQELPPELEKFDTEEDRLVARLADKGVILPEFPDDTYNEKTKHILMEHALIAAGHKHHLAKAERGILPLPELDDAYTKKTKKILMQHSLFAAGHKKHIANLFEKEKRLKYEAKSAHSLQILHTNN